MSSCDTTNHEPLRSQAINSLQRTSSQIEPAS
jgi:hypothetical protein